MPVDVVFIMSLPAGLSIRPEKKDKFQKKENTGKSADTLSMTSVDLLCFFIFECTECITADAWGPLLFSASVC